MFMRQSPKPLIEVSYLFFVRNTAARISTITCNGNMNITKNDGIDVLYPANAYFIFFCDACILTCEHQNFSFRYYYLLVSTMCIAKANYSCRMVFSSNIAKSSDSILKLRLDARATCMSLKPHFRFSSEKDWITTLFHLSPAPEILKRQAQQLILSKLAFTVRSRLDFLRV
uniref:Uncharacterized protein n=1 Tax=Aplanochytrium stocchinoi TaxID=215587 RepID=A0A7S3LPP5_9STRA